MSGAAAAAGKLEPVGQQPHVAVALLWKDHNCHRSSKQLR